MKKFLLLLSIVFIVSACCNEKYTFLPDEDVEEVLKAMYDSEWGGIKAQLLSSIDFYECITEPNCTMSEEYMDTVQYNFVSGDISHEKKILYDWEFLQNESPDVTELKLTAWISPSNFQHPNFSYEYNIVELTIIVKDDTQEEDYHIGLDIWIAGNYIDEKFDENLRTSSVCGLKINKSSREIQPHVCNDQTTIYHPNPCDYYEPGNLHYYNTQYSIQ